MDYIMNLSAANVMFSFKQMTDYLWLLAYRSKPFLQFVIGGIWVNLQNLTSKSVYIKLIVYRGGGA